MAREIKTVVLIGASGTLGPPIITALNEANLKVVVISRPESKASFPEGVEVKKVGISKEGQDALTQVLKDVQADAVISLVGGNALKQQKIMIEAALEAGVARFIPSEFGANTDDEKVRELVPLYHERKACTDYLDALSQKHETFSWTGIIAGAFFDWGLEDGFLDFELESKTANILDSGKVPFCLTNLSLVAECIRNILTRHDAFEASRNKYVHIANHIATQTQILQALESATGESWKIEKRHSNEVRDECQRIWESKAGGDMAAVVPMVKVAGWGDERVYDSLPSSDTSEARGCGDFRNLDSGLWNERLGLAAPDSVSLADDVSAVLKRN